MISLDHSPLCVTTLLHPESVLFAPHWTALEQAAHGSVLHAEMPQSLSHSEQRVTALNCSAWCVVKAFKTQQVLCQEAPSIGKTFF